MEFLYLLVPLAIIILIIVFFSLFPIGLWIEAVASGVHVSIFSMFGMRLRRINPSKIVRPLIKAQKAGIAIDPGLKNPLSAHWYAADWDGNIYVIAEHYAAGKDIDFHARAILAMCDKLGWKRDGRGRVEALIDSAAGQRTLAAEKSVAELFAERGILADMRVEKDVFSGIERVKSYLSRENGLPDLYIFSGCVNMIREFKSYFWGNSDAPVKRDDHAMDELRYFLMSRPRPAERVQLPAPIAKDKERRIRALLRSRRAGSGVLGGVPDREVAGHRPH